MKKFIATALIALFATACTSTENAGMINKGMMCEKCPCCQKMMENGMKEDMMKEGMQYPMIKNCAKDGKPCGCCGGMMKDGMNNMKSSPVPKPADDADHKAHHPQQ